MWGLGGQTGKQWGRLGWPPSGLQGAPKRFLILGTPMPYPKMMPAAFLDPYSGRIMVFGGMSIYPQEIMLWLTPTPPGAWEVGPSSAWVNGANNTRVMSKAFCQLSDGRVFGFTIGPDGSYAQIFNPVTNSWFTCAPHPVPDVLGKCVANLPSGRILVWGGTSDQPYIYDPAANTWTPTQGKFKLWSGFGMAWTPPGAMDNMTGDVLISGSAQFYKYIESADRFTLQDSHPYGRASAELTPMVGSILDANETPNFGYNYAGRLIVWNGLTENVMRSTDNKYAVDAQVTGCQLADGRVVMMGFSEVPYEGWAPSPNIYIWSPDSIAGPSPMLKAKKIKTHVKIIQDYDGGVWFIGGNDNPNATNAVEYWKP